MKNLFIFLIVSSLAGAAQAKQVCVQVPEGLQYDSMIANFDGSVSIKSPQVRVSGALVKLQSNSGRGMCYLLGKELVAVSRIDSSSERSVLLSDTGQLLTIPGFYLTAIDEILCK